MAERAQERRERDRAYSAAYRARKRAEAAERARLPSDGSDGESRQMRDALEGSFSAAKWLTGSDAAAMQQARSLAGIVDNEKDLRMLLRAHALLGRVLAEMGLTPRVRTQLELRARKLDMGVTAAATDAAIAEASNVSKLPRPTPGRRR